MRRATLLFSAAAAALLVGGWPALSRVYADYTQRSAQGAQQQQQQQLQARASALKAELQASKPAIVADLQRLQAEGLHREVLAKAARYRLANDPDIRAIHARSAQELSFRQTLDKLARLTAEHCNDAAVRRHLEGVMAPVQSLGARVDSSAWDVRQLDTAAFIAPIQTSLRTAAAARQAEGGHEHEDEHGHEHGHGANVTSVAELFHVDRLPRLHPALAYALMNDQLPNRQICVWEVKGKAALGALTQSLAKPFELVVWMMASPTERSMEYGVLRVEGF